MQASSGGHVLGSRPEPEDRTWPCPLGDLGTCSGAEKPRALAMVYAGPLRVLTMPLCHTPSVTLSHRWLGLGLLVLAEGWGGGGNRAVGWGLLPQGSH